MGLAPLPGTTGAEARCVSPVGEVQEHGSPLRRLSESHRKGSQEREAGRARKFPATTVAILL
jgi:hypothetical protein